MFIQVFKEIESREIQTKSPNGNKIQIDFFCRVSIDTKYLFRYKNILKYLLKLQLANFNQKINNNNKLHNKYLNYIYGDSRTVLY